jgi:Planctomycete extracellular
MSRFEPKVRWWSATTRSLPQFAPARRPHTRRRLRLECLEDRTMLSTTIPLTVNTLADDPTGVPISGYTTLRDAITQADNGATSNQYVVTFSVSGTIDLTSPLPDLDNNIDNIDVEGPGASQGRRIKVRVSGRLGTCL